VRVPHISLAGGTDTKASTPFPMGAKHQFGQQHAFSDDP